MKKEKKKMSIDFDDVTYKLLSEYKNDICASSYGETINSLVGIFLGLSKDIKRELALFCAEQINTEDNSTKVAGAFERDALEQKRKEYKDLLHFFTDGTNMVAKEKKAMQRIGLSDGYVIFPEEWIVLEDTIKKGRRYAGVVETRNGENYNVPHFMFLSSKPVKQMSTYDEEEIIKTCVKVFPEYRQVLDRCIPAQMDSAGKVLNPETWLAAPRPGCFEIQEYGVHGAKYPMGAMIVRTEIDTPHS